MRFVSLDRLDDVQLEALAALTLEAAARYFPGWLPTLDAAREEVDDALDQLRTMGPSRAVAVALIDGEDGVVAWGAAAYDWGRVWELHPAMVGVAFQRRGYGRLLAAELEREAAAHGALTMVLGTSDLTGETSLFGVDVYAEPLGVIGVLARLSSAGPAGHPFAFWQRCGYSVVGMLPDAEGDGRPSIQLAKRIAARSS